MTEKTTPPSRSCRTSTDLPPSRWQVKLLGYYWQFQLDSWSEWHGRDCDARMRRAWWWLWHWNGSKARSCLRICGISLHSKATHFIDYSRYGV